MKKIVNQDKNSWKVVLIKTIENKEPIYYRIVNLSNFSIKTIPAYRILDEIISEGLNIINLKCEDNRPKIIDSQGYESTEEVIVIDEFDNEISSVFDWCIENSGIGSHILSRFDSVKNQLSPESYKINEIKKLAWTCKNNHTIHCGFPTFFSLRGICPICSKEENDEIASFEDWCNYTNNKNVLEQYNSAEENTKQASEISYRTHKLVWFYNKDRDEKVQEYLDNITVKGKKLFEVQENMGISTKNNSTENNKTRKNKNKASKN